MSLLVKQFIKPPLRNNNYIVADDEKKTAVLIDCSSPDDEIMNWVKKNNLKLEYILITHAHFDHILGVNYYLNKYGLKAFCYEKDAALVERVNEYINMLHFQEVEQPQLNFFDLTSKFKVGGYPIEIIETPGHTMGGVCYLIDKNLFSGDTLFQGTCGRTDLRESDENAMRESLSKLFKKLPDATPVYPGHGAPTTIGQERNLY